MSYYKPDLKLKTTFDSEAGLYEGSRPGYPNELFERLVEVTNLNEDANLLEIGTGTGKATKPLVEKGFKITGIELGSQLAKFARKVLQAYPNVDIINSSYEDADLPLHSYDLIFSASAIHWIRPEVKYTKTHALLKPGGYMAIIWGRGGISDENGDKLYYAKKEIHDKYFPDDEFHRLPQKVSELKPPDDIDAELFELVHFECFPREMRFTTEEYLKHMGTYSRCIALDKESRKGADVDISSTGHIYYRQTQNSTILAKAKNEINNAFPQLPHINFTWAFIATWYNVTYYQCSSPDYRKSNIFQATLVSNGVQSFAIFYYNQISWTTGDANGGYNGLGSTPAFAGFDADDDKHRYSIPRSCTTDIINIANESNFGKPGVFFFRIDDWTIIQPSTTTTSPTTDAPTTTNKITSTSRRPTSTSAPSTPPTTQEPNSSQSDGTPCNCNNSELWLDLMLVIDRSAGVGRFGLPAIGSQLLTILHDPKTIAAQMNNSNTFIITVDLSGVNTKLLGQISTPFMNFSSTNSGDNEAVYEVQTALCYANCVCPSQTVQLKTYDPTTKRQTYYSDCFQSVTSGTYYKYAEKVCEKRKGTLASLTTPIKNHFLLSNEKLFGTLYIKSLASVIQDDRDLQNISSLHIGLHRDTSISNGWLWYGYDNTVYQAS
uniref:NIDO domain-containing protein n=1 Tax=Acrobeloides nanus TaxID=290746 RepID=A0A914E7V5_9BILA